MIIWLCLVGVAILAWALTRSLRKYALSRSLVDIPNERSSHSIPTPRGGGVAIVISFLIGLLLLLLLKIISINLFLSFAGAGAIVALIGFIDDHGHVAARWRLLAHFSSAIWGLYWLDGLPALELFGTVVNLNWVGHILAIIYLVWLLNLYNFMDGIDGIAGIEAISVCFGATVLFWLKGVDISSSQLPVLFLLGAVLGFLIWNFPPAKIFMGDAGSGFIGLILGLFSIAAAHVDQSLFWGWIILLGAFIVDATVTLIRRVFEGHAFYEAHRTHAYQYLSRKIASHKRVSISFGIINLLWLLPMASLVVLGYLDGFISVCIAYLPLIGLAWVFKAGNQEQQEV